MIHRLAQAGCSHDLVTLGVPLPELVGLKFQFASVLPPSLLTGPKPQSFCGRLLGGRWQAASAFLMFTSSQVLLPLIWRHTLGTATQSRAAAAWDQLLLPHQTMSVWDGRAAPLLRTVWDVAKSHGKWGRQQHLTP